MFIALCIGSWRETSPVVGGAVVVGVRVETVLLAAVGQETVNTPGPVQRLGARAHVGRGLVGRAGLSLGPRVGCSQVSYLSKFKMLH